MKKIYSILCLFIAVSAMVSCSSDDKIVVSSLNSIISFEIDFEGLTADDVNYDLGNDITISVPFGTNLVALISTIEVDAKATITPASGEALDFTDGEAIEFTVTAEDAVTTKMYNVTINVRGEVGSGTKLKTYTFTEDFGFINIVTSTTLTYNETSNFVTTISTKEEEEEDAFVETLIYDAKNQVIEKTAEGENTVYSYNAEGQITQAVFMRGEVKKYTYDYTYDSNGSLATEIRIDHEESDVNRNKYNQAYTVKDGNLIKIVKGVNTTTIATYDTKNNPFKGIYPAAYANINISQLEIGVNNPITLTTVDDDIAYIYNDDNYPVSRTYANAGFNVAYKYEFTYFE